MKLALKKKKIIDSFIASNENINPNLSLEYRDESIEYRNIVGILTTVRRMSVMRDTSMGS